MRRPASKGFHFGGERNVATLVNRATRLNAFALVEAGAKSATRSLWAIAVVVALGREARVITSPLATKLAANEGAVGAAAIGIVVAVVAEGAAAAGSRGVANAVAGDTYVAVRGGRANLIQQAVGVGIALARTDFLAATLDAKRGTRIAIEAALAGCTAFTPQANVAKQTKRTFLVGAAVGAKVCRIETGFQALTAEAVVALLAVAVFGAADGRIVAALAGTAGVAANVARIALDATIKAGTAFAIAGTIQGGAIGLGVAFSLGHAEHGLALVGRTGIEGASLAGFGDADVAIVFVGACGLVELAVSRAGWVTLETAGTGSLLAIALPESTKGSDAARLLGGQTIVAAADEHVFVCLVIDGTLAGLRARVTIAVGIADQGAHVVDTNVARFATVFAALGNAGPIRVFDAAALFAGCPGGVGTAALHRSRQKRRRQSYCLDSTCSKQGVLHHLAPSNQSRFIHTSARQISLGEPVASF